MDFISLTIKFLTLLAKFVGNYGMAIIVLTIIVCIFGLLALIVSSKFLKFLYLFIGLDLLIMGYNNERIFRKEGLTIVYIASGIALVIYSILKFIGVL